MKLFYNSDGTVKVLPVSALPANTVWNGGFPYTPEGSLLVSIVSAKPTDTVSNGGFIQELWGGVCAGYDTPSVWIGGLAVTSYGALCLDVDGGIVTDGPALYNSLTHTAIPTRGSIVPTFTRATTATGQKWDEAGYLDFTALAGEAVFKGARRERNYITGSSENLANAAWAKTAAGDAVTGGITDVPSGKAQSTRITPDGTTTFHGVNQTITIATGNTLVASTSMKDDGCTYGYMLIGGANKEAVFNLATGVVSNVSAGVTADIESEGGGWYRCSLVRTVGAAEGNIYTGPTTSATTGNSAAAAANKILMTGVQWEDVTGQTTQTASEYVSVGVESAPAYHGSMVDGVKCYSTDRSGNPISTSGSYPLVGYVPWEARTNLCLQSNAFTTTWVDFSGTCAAVQNVAGPDGTTSAWTLTDDAVGATEGRSLTIALTDATTYTLSAFIKKTTGAQTSYPAITAYKALYSVGVCVNTTAGTAVAITAYQGATIGTTNNITVKDFNTDYWRVAFTFTTNATANWIPTLHPAFNANGTGVELGTATGSAVFYGAQVELGSFATPYIPTTTVAVARNADVDQYPTTDGPIAAAGSIALDFTPYHAPSGTIALWGTYVDASNYTAILHDATNLIFRKRIAGSNYDATIANAFVSGTTCKIAATWGAAGTAIYLDGVAGTPHANTTAAQIAATMQVGADGNSLQQPGAGTTNLRIWQRQLSSPEGVAVTA